MTSNKSVNEHVAHYIFSIYVNVIQLLHAKNLTDLLPCHVYHVYTRSIKINSRPLLYFYYSFSFYFKFNNKPGVSTATNLSQTNIHCNLIYMYYIICLYLFIYLDENIYIYIVKNYLPKFIYLKRKKIYFLYRTVIFFFSFVLY